MAGKKGRKATKTLGKKAMKGVKGGTAMGGGTGGKVRRTGGTSFGAVAFGTLS